MFIRINAFQTMMTKDVQAHGSYINYQGSLEGISWKPKIKNSTVKLIMILYLLMEVLCVFGGQ